MKTILFILLVSSCFISCTRMDVFEKSDKIQSQQWFYNDKHVFTVAVTDTASLYNVYVILRHTDAYNYNNIWLNFGSQAPGDSMHFQNININLGNDVKGWEGNGMDDIWEVRKNITNGPVPFKKTGNYTFSISQIMRENPLKHILNVGIRLEKVNF